MAARRARYRWISIPRRCRRTGFSADRYRNRRWPSRTRSNRVGTAKIGSYRYMVQPWEQLPPSTDHSRFQQLPWVKTINGATIYLRDVGHVRDGFPPQQSVVHVDGNRAVLTTILKNRIGFSDPEHRPGHSGKAAVDRAAGAEQLEDQPAQRPIDLRQVCGQRRGTGKAQSLPRSPA